MRDSVTSTSLIRELFQVHPVKNVHKFYGSVTHRTYIRAIPQCPFLFNTASPFISRAVQAAMVTAGFAPHAARSAGAGAGGLVQHGEVRGGGMG